MGNEYVRNRQAAISQGQIYPYYQWRCLENQIFKINQLTIFQGTIFEVKYILLIVFGGSDFQTHSLEDWLLSHKFLLSTSHCDYFDLRQFKHWSILQCGNVYIGLHEVMSPARCVGIKESTIEWGIPLEMLQMGQEWGKKYDNKCGIPQLEFKALVNKLDKCHNDSRTRDWYSNINSSTSLGTFGEGLSFEILDRWPHSLKTKISRKNTTTPQYNIDLINLFTHQFVCNNNISGMSVNRLTFREAHYRRQMSLVTVEERSMKHNVLPKLQQMAESYGQWFFVAIPATFFVS